MLPLIFGSPVNLFLLPIFPLVSLYFLMYSTETLPISSTVKLFSKDSASLSISTSDVLVLEFLYTLANTYYDPPVLLLFFYYLWGNKVFPGPLVLPHILLHWPRMQSPNHSLTGPFLRAVLVVSNPEG